MKCRITSRFRPFALALVAIVSFSALGCAENETATPAPVSDAPAVEDEPVTETATDE